MDASARRPCRFRGLGASLLAVLLAETPVCWALPGWEELTEPLEKAGVPSWAVAAGLGGFGTAGAVVPYVNQLQAPGAKAVAAAPALAMGAVVGSTIETGDYVGTATKFSNLLTPGCPETHFQYPWFGNTLGGTISATLPGWEAKVMCDGDNEYAGPPLACKKDSKGALGFKMDAFNFVKKEDLDKEGGTVFLAQQLRCRARPASSQSRDRERRLAEAPERSAWSAEAWQSAEEQAEREFKAWASASRHTGAKLFVSTAVSGAVAVAVAEVAMFTWRRVQRRKAGAYQHLEVAEPEA